MATVEMLDASEFSNKVEAGEGLTLVDFYADWCGPCKMIAPVLEDLAAEYEDSVKVVKLDADVHPEVLSKYGVRGLPTLMMFENGKPVGTRVGAQPASALRTFISEFA